MYLDDRALRELQSIIKDAATTFASTPRKSFNAAAAVPPVASRSSIKTDFLLPFSDASAWISIVSVPYSRSYDNETVLPGSLFFFLSIVRPIPRRIGEGCSD